MKTFLLLNIHNVYSHLYDGVLQLRLFWATWTQNFHQIFTFLLVSVLSAFQATLSLLQNLVISSLCLLASLPLSIFPLFGSKFLYTPFFSLLLSPPCCLRSSHFRWWCLFPFLFCYWSITALQCCAGFCRTTMLADTSSFCSPSQYMSWSLCPVLPSYLLAPACFFEIAQYPRHSLCSLCFLLSLNKMLPLSIQLFKLQEKQQQAENQGKGQLYNS